MIKPSRKTRKAANGWKVEIMNREMMIEILMRNYSTKSEAEKHLDNGTTIFEDFEENFEAYMREWDIEEEEIPAYKKMIEEKKALPDWGIVEYNGKNYYISYCL